MYNFLQVIPCQTRKNILVCKSIYFKTFQFSNVVTYFFEFKNLETELRNKSLESLVPKSLFLS